MDVSQLTDRPDAGVDYQEWKTSRRLFGHYRPLPRGRSVLKLGGVYRTVDTPTQLELDAATEAYLGGHIYTVSQAVADALAAAGYTTTAEPSAPVRTITWNFLSGGTWDDFVDNYGTWA
jgi:hypothetical protein